MPNMSPKKAPMPTQEPNVRNKNFLEVATGFQFLILSRKLHRATLQVLMM